MTYILADFNPVAIAEGIASRMKDRRLELNLTQLGLAKKAGVSLGTLKRFESQSEISLKHLLMISVALDATEEFKSLFTRHQYQSIDELLSYKEVKQRKRGRNV